MSFQYIVSLYDNTITGGGNCVAVSSEFIVNVYMILVPLMIIDVPNVMDIVELLTHNRALGV